MAEIVRYLETDDYGIQTGRQLIAMRDAALLPAAARARWQNDPAFDLARELLAAPSIKGDLRVIMKRQPNRVEGEEDLMPGWST